MDTSVSRRMRTLSLHLASEGAPSTVSMAPTSSPAQKKVQREIQLLLEHDNHKERDAMKALMKSDLFVP